MRKLLFLGLSVWSACSAPQGDRGRAVPGERSDASPASMSANSSPLRRFLSERGYHLDSIAAERGPYIAALAQNERDGKLYLFPLRQTEGSFILLGGPDEMMEGYRPQRVEWLSLNNGPVDAFMYTHDIIGEGVIGTAIYAVRQDSLWLLHQPKGYECRPAVLRDVDGDGRPELLEFTEDPSRGDCGSLCHFALDGKFGMGPHWVTIYRWTGERWERAEEAYPEFYAQLAARYRMIHRWLHQNTGAEGDHHIPDECLNIPWIRDNPQLFHAWAQRADSIASLRR